MANGADFVGLPSIVVQSGSGASIKIARYPQAAVQHITAMRGLVCITAFVIAS